MTNETTLLIETDLPIPFVCADGTGIEKGAICKMADLMTASLSSAKEDICAGIASEEKIADDGNVTIGIYRGGIFRATASGNITVGDGLITSCLSTNLLETAGTAVEDIVGVALETATDGETFRFELNPITVNQA